MAFRANEKTKDNLARATDYLTRNLAPNQRSKSAMYLEEVIHSNGPVVDGYPVWHPLLTAGATLSGSENLLHGYRPSPARGYRGMDHTVYLANGFITCPYEDSGNQEMLLASVETLQHKHCMAEITIHELDFPLYNNHPKTTPFLVKCSWFRPLASDHTIPKSLALPLFLESVLPAWKNLSNDRCAECWENMRPMILGIPHGSRSSLFVNEETGQALKNLWIMLINTGMFGPVMPPEQ